MRLPLNKNRVEYLREFSSVVTSVKYDSVNDVFLITQKNANLFSSLLPTDFSTDQSATVNDASAIGYDSVSDLYYVSNEFGGTNQPQANVDASTFAVSTNVFTSPPDVAVVRGYEFDIVDDKLFLSNFAYNSVEVYEASTLTHLSTISITSPIGIYLDQTNKLLYVAVGSNKKIKIYNSNTYAFIENINLLNQSEVYEIRVDNNDSNILLFSDRIKKQIGAVEISTKSFLGTTAVGSITGFFDVKDDSIYYATNSIFYLARTDKFY